MTKDPFEILSDADLMAEWKWNKNFIDRHSKKMKSRGRPRQFVRINVMQFAVEYFGIDLLTTSNKAAQAEELFKALNQPFPMSDAFPRIEGGKILGRGGKRVAA